MTPPANVIEISLKPGVQPQIDAALALRSTGHLEEALRSLANPNEYNAYLYTIRGEIEFALGRYPDAALSYFAVVHSEPDNADAHYNLGLCLQRSDRWDASCQAFERALSLDPGHGAARPGPGRQFTLSESAGRSARAPSSNVRMRWLDRPLSARR